VLGTRWFRLPLVILLSLLPLLVQVLLTGLGVLVLELRLQKLVLFQCQPLLWRAEFLLPVFLALLLLLLLGLVRVPSVAVLQMIVLVIVLVIVLGLVVLLVA